MAAALVLSAAAALCSACGTSAPASSPALSGTITVFAAASLHAAYTAIGKEFQKSHPGTMVTFPFGGSSMLVSQIQQGAIGDVVASADQPNMKKIIDAGLTAESPIMVARHDLLIVGGGGGAHNNQA